VEFSRMEAVCQPYQYKRMSRRHASRRAQNSSHVVTPRWDGRGVAGAAKDLGYGCHCGQANRVVRGRYGRRIGKRLFACHVIVAGTSPPTPVRYSDAAMS